MNLEEGLLVCHFLEVASKAGTYPEMSVAAVTTHYTCYRGARPSSYIFGYIKTRKFTHNIFKITCKNVCRFPRNLPCGGARCQSSKNVPIAYTNNR